MAFSDYSATPANNTSIAGQNIAPGGPPSAVGPAVRQLMADGRLATDYTAPDPTAYTRQITDRLADSIRAHDHGAFGDGSPHPLSERFSTLADAQAEFPGCTVTALTDRFDGLAIEAAINRAKKIYLPGSQGGYLTRAAVQLRPGRYTITRSIKLPNSVELIGAGSGATIIDAQNWTVPGPLVVNAEVGSVDMRLSALSLHGGTHGVKIDSGATGQVNSLRFHDVAMRLQSDKNMEVNRLLQQAFFDNCVFGQAPYGLYVPAWTTNFVRFTNTSFEEISWIPVLLRSGETVVFDGGRFEAGGNNGWAAFTGSISGTTLTVTSQFQGMIRPGGILYADGGSPITPGTSIVRQLTGSAGGIGTYEVNYSQTVASRPLLNIAATIDLDRATINDLGCQVTFNGTYFENTAPVLIRDHHSRDGVSFNNCHFTQAVDRSGIAAAYTCESDGTIAFGNNDISVQPVYTPTNVLINGQTKQKLFGNSNVYRSKALGAVSFKSRRVMQTGTTPIPAVRFQRDASTGFAQSDGTLRVHVNGFDGSTGAAVIGYATFRVVIYGGTLTMLPTSDPFTGLAAAATLNIELAPGATATDATIRILPGNFNASTPSNFWWSYVEEGGSLASEECLRVTCL